LDNVTIELIARAMQRVVDRWLPPPPVDDVVSRLQFTVNDCITRIETAVAIKPQITFSEMLDGISLRVEIIISLLALLELLKRNVVIAWQEQPFGEIVIEAVVREPGADTPEASPDADESFAG
jgi:segregation and condensation protein A